MSCWTHVVAVYHIETYKQEKDIKIYVEKLLENAPKITGSERDADIFVNVLSGYNVFIGADCGACEYKESIIYDDTGGFSCDADKNYKCPKGDYQTRVVITVIGNLRDRMKDITKQELKEFERYLRLKKKGCYFDIENKAVKILDN